MDFSIDEEDGRARKGEIKVNGRIAKTPLFMPVATVGGVKTLISEDLVELGVDALITNMYHLLMKPGIQVIEEAGGLHKFMNWDGVIFTDSGGFQMIRKGFDHDFDSKGVSFKSDYDGSTYEITPEDNITYQKRLGSDISMCLDHCPPYPTKKEKVYESVKRTTGWARECRKAGDNIFGISQGGVHPDLREKSCKDIVKIGFEGYAVGGLSIGEPEEKMYEMIGIADNIFPKDKPRYLMGLGSPVEMLESISRGMDIFDSAYPTRNARHRSVFTYDGTINIRNSRYKKDFTPLDNRCNCPICQNYSKAYINHLCRSEELAWMRMTSIHNLNFLIQLLRDARTAIHDKRYNEFKEQFIKNYQ